MLKQKQKKLIKKIFLSAILGLLLFFTAPASITNNRAYAEESPQDKACKTHFGVVCSEVTEQKYKDNCQAYDQCKDYETFKNQAESGTKEPIDLENAKDAISFLVEMQKFLNRLIWPILFMIGGLMDNSLLFGSGMEARLREIWIPIRNIVNMLFVIVLVGIALYNVLGIGDENGSYSIKAILPKIVVGIIAVNFSFIGIKVFLDAINVLTVSVFSLPSQIDEGLGKIITAPTTSDAEVIKRLCRGMKGIGPGEKISQEELKALDQKTIYRVVGQKYQMDPRYAALFQNNRIKPTDNEQVIEAKVKQALQSDQGAIAQFQKDVQLKADSQICTGEFLTPQGIVFLSRWESRNAALAMALNMGKIVFYEDVPLDVNKIEQLAINTIFSFMMWLIYAASFVALFVVLLARLVVMWLAIALSPVLLLMLAVPAVKEQISGFGEIQSQFVKNALAPLGIALSMTIGWVMLRALQGINSISDGSVITFEAYSSTIPVVGLNTLQDLVVALGTVAVVWMGVFTAASSSIAAPVTDWMKVNLQKAGSFLGTLPLKHVPLVPITIKGQKETYTGEELLEGLGVIGNKAPSQRLADKLRGGSTTKMDAWHKDPTKFTDGTGLASLFNRNESELKAGNQDAIDELVKMRKANTKAYQDLIRKQPDIDKAIKRYDDLPEANKTDAERQKLGKEVWGLSQQITKDSYDGKPVAPSATPAAAATPAITPTTLIGTQSVQQKIPNPGTAASTAAVMNTEIDKLKTALAAPNPNPRKIQDEIGRLNPAFHGITIAQLQTLLGSNYAKLETLLGGEPAVRAALAGIAAAPTAVPTPNPQGGGVTPGGGQPAQPGQPPAPAPQPPAPGGGTGAQPGANPTSP